MAPVFMNQTLLISDLIEFHVERVGSTSVTIPANTGSGTADQTLSPALTGTFNTDYVPIASVKNEVSNVAYSAKPVLNSATVLRIRVARPGQRFNMPGGTDIDIANAGLTEIVDTAVVGTSHQHIIDNGTLGIGASPHDHPFTITGTTNWTGDPQATVTVYWAIFHI